MTRVDTNGPFEDDQIINLGSFTSGTLTMNYNNNNYAGLGYTNIITVFYGGTNTLTGAGVQLASITNSGVGTLVVPFGPNAALNTVTTNQLIIVMNRFGVSTPPSVTWNYTASVTVASGQGILVGGQFNVAGQSYANIARLNSTNGALDTSFNPGTGTDSKVLALGWQLNDQIVAGGIFTHVNGNGTLQSHCAAEFQWFDRHHQLFCRQRGG